MNPSTTSAFDLSGHPAKSDPALIAADEQHLVRVADAVAQAVADVSDRLEAARHAPAGSGQAALDRDQEVHRLTARLGVLRRFGPDLCLGRMVGADGSDLVYVGRVGLTDRAGRRLLVDWRTPAAEPFFAASHADPMGLSSRRRYRWTRGRISDFWDESFVVDLDGSDGDRHHGAAGPAAHLALDDQSAFIASLAESRSPRMRDVLGTIAADQDAIVRAGSAGALVVDGGPGTGKTVVALHRAAYLLHSDPRVARHRGGVLVVGPSRPYLDYVADVLPSLGEEGVQTCTVRDLVPEGAAAAVEDDPEVARLLADARMVGAVEPAVGLYEKPPSEGMEVETPYADVWLSTADWAEAYEAVEPGTPHNEARDQVWEALLSILVDTLRDEVGDGADDEGELSSDELRRAQVGNRDLVRTFSRAWPLLEATDLVGDLRTVPAYLRMCAPWLGPDEVRALQREDPTAWTVSDLPLLDAARRRLGDPDAARRRRRREAAVAAERARRSDVVDDLVAADDSEMLVMSMLRGQDLQDALVDDEVRPVDPDLLAGPFAHVVVDEAQELTDAEWQMLVARCPSRSLTVVGDRAQARQGFSETWQERLARAGLDRVEVASLSINYRTPTEVMAEAERAIRAAVPDANVPTSVRSTGVPVQHASTADRDRILDAWLAEHAEGTACVVGDPTAAARPRVASLTPAEAKGLEFDLVVLVDPGAFGTDVQGAVDRYVAMTRATQRLVVLRSA
ncbi:RNA polymerase recycling motor ATPase HelR [Cellulosimicrobium sp. NPDC057127]|uniref:RNA polymerase recycling motor ATPase HelR n=1 Tax=Cellulosimicrobium sp. NPDC057127 TaxID=3346026 RepID=UPI00363B78C3